MALVGNAKLLLNLFISSLKISKGETDCVWTNTAAKAISFLFAAYLHVCCICYSYFDELRMFPSSFPKTTCIHTHKIHANYANKSNRMESYYIFNLNSFQEHCKDCNSMWVNVHFIRFSLNSQSLCKIELFSYESRFGISICYR